MNLTKEFLEQVEAQKRSQVSTLGGENALRMPSCFVQTFNVSHLRLSSLDDILLAVPVYRLKLLFRSLSLSLFQK